MRKKELTCPYSRTTPAGEPRNARSAPRFLNPFSPPCPPTKMGGFVGASGKERTGTGSRVSVGRSRGRGNSGITYTVPLIILFPDCGELFHPRVRVFEEHFESGAEVIQPRVGRAAVVPVQVSATSQVGSARAPRQTTLLALKVFVGQSLVAPVQVSARSHSGGSRST